MAVKEATDKLSSTGIHPGLKPFKAGADPRRNTNGRPPRPHCVSDLLFELIDGDAEKVEQKWLKQTKNHPTGGMTIALAIFDKMGRGDLTAIKEGLDRVEGRVTEHTDVTSKGESLNHTTVEVVSDKAKEATELILSGKIEQCAN